MVGSLVGCRLFSLITVSISNSTALHRQRGQARLHQRRRRLLRRAVRLPVRRSTLMALHVSPFKKTASRTHSPFAHTHTHSYRLKAACIIVHTEDGTLARAVAKYHPHVPVMCFTSSQKVAKQVRPPSPVVKEGRRRSIDRGSGSQWPSPPLVTTTETPWAPSQSVSQSPARAWRIERRLTTPFDWKLISYPHINS